MEIERRSFSVKEVRVSKNDGGGKRIVGYAAVFNSLSEDLGGFYERIQQGAFTKTLQEADIRALFNHDPNYPLGRVKAGTLSLEEDEVGLRFNIELPNTQYANDLAVSMERGDVDQMSFGFSTIRDKWEQIGDQIVRTLIEVKLFDVSPVTFPAYTQTTAEVRSRFMEFQEEHAAPAQESHPADGDEAQARARLGILRRKLELIEHS